MPRSIMVYFFGFIWIACLAPWASFKLTTGQKFQLDEQCLFPALGIREKRSESPQPPEQGPQIDETSNINETKGIREKRSESAQLPELWTPLPEQETQPSEQETPPTEQGTQPTEQETQPTEQETQPTEQETQPTEQRSNRNEAKVYSASLQDTEKMLTMVLEQVICGQMKIGRNESQREFLADLFNISTIVNASVDHCFMAGHIKKQQRRDVMKGTWEDDELLRTVSSKVLEDLDEIEENLRNTEESDEFSIFGMLVADELRRRNDLKLMESILKVIDKN